MTKWNDINECDYPSCDADEAVPVWIVSGTDVIEAWYKNPSMDDCWFESDSGSVIDAHLWIETLEVIGKPELPMLTTRRMQAFIDANKISKVVSGERRTPENRPIKNDRDMKDSDRIRYKLSNGDVFIITREDQSSVSYHPIWDI